MLHPLISIIALETLSHDMRSGCLEESFPADDLAMVIKTQCLKKDTRSL